MVDEVERRWGGTDVLVHNALIPFAITSFAKLSWEQLGGKLDSELRAAFLVTKAVVPGMISRGYGRLVYLTTGLPQLSLANEVMANGINALCTSTSQSRPTAVRLHRPSR